MKHAIANNPRRLEASTETKVRVLEQLHLRGYASYGSLNLEQRRALLQKMFNDGLLDGKMNVTAKGIAFIKDNKPWLKVGNPAGRSWLHDLPKEDIERAILNTEKEIQRLEDLAFDVTTGLGYQRSKHNKQTIETLKRDLKGYKEIFASKSNPRGGVSDRMLLAMQRVKDTTYGLPVDQLTPSELPFVYNSPRVFEEDNGYIKLTAYGKKRLSKEMEKQYKNPNWQKPHLITLSEAIAYLEDKGYSVRSIDGTDSFFVQSKFGETPKVYDYFQVITLAIQANRLTGNPSLTRETPNPQYDTFNSRVMYEVIGIGGTVVNAANHLALAKMFAQEYANDTNRIIGVEEIDEHTGKRKLVAEVKPNYKNPGRNPHGFAIIDEHLNVQRRGADYDKLQDIVDRHNEEFDSVWMVVDASDLAEVQGSRKNPNYYTNELIQKHVQAVNDEEDFGTESITRTIRRHAQELAKEMDVPLWVAETWIKENRRNRQYKKHNPLSEAARETLAAEADTLAGESDRLREVVGNPLFGRGMPLDNGHSQYAVFEIHTRKGLRVMIAPVERVPSNAKILFIGNHSNAVDFHDDYLEENTEKRSNPYRDELDEYAAYELYLFITTDSKYTRQREAIYKNLITKMAQGKYDSARAPQAFAALTDKASKDYEREFGDTFNKVDRMEAARQMAEFFEAEAPTGNYDYMLPKKYQKNPKADKAFLVVITPKNSQSRESTQQITIWATSRERAIAQARAQVRQLTDRRATNYNYVAFPANGNPRSVANEHYGKVDFFDDKVDEISAEFTGRISGESMEVGAPDGTPKKLARLGHLRLIKITTPKGETLELRFNDDADAWLAADRRKNLYFVGRDANATGAMKLPKAGHVAELGAVTQIDYFTTKEHIESAKPTYFYHELGEVDGITPTAYVDSEGFIRLYGGNYDIWTCGIVN